MDRLIGRWRIVEMDDWDRDALDLVGPAYIELTRDRRGSFGFSVVEGSLDAKTVDGAQPPKLEFTWEGNDEGTAVSGRGWVELEPDGSLRGHMFFHLGDDAVFRAVTAGEND
jgi:hypothetical protein